MVYDWFKIEILVSKYFLVYLFSAPSSDGDDKKI